MGMSEGLHYLSVLFVKDDIRKTLAEHNCR